MVDPPNYFSFQPVLHNCCALIFNKWEHLGMQYFFGIELSHDYTLTIAAQNVLGIKNCNNFYMNFIDSYVISEIKWTATCLKL